jgi:hypothetical protein
MNPMSVHPTSPNILKYLKAHIDTNTIVVGDFNTLLSPVGYPNKKILNLNDSIDETDLTGMYRILHLTRAHYTFFSGAHGTFPKIDHIRAHKATLSKYKKIEIMPCILSHHNAIKLELNNKNNSRKHTNNWRLNNTFLNDQ